MTRDEFIEGYCAWLGATWVELSERFEALPCTCGEIGCKGWQIQSKRIIKMMARRAATAKEKG